MRSSNTSRLAAPAGIASGLLFISNAAAVPIDLNDFFFEPSTAVTVSADGSSATLVEDAEFGAVSLWNLGDPEVIVGGDGVFLAFDYAFDEPLGNDDIFHVAVLDGLTGIAIGDVFEAVLSASGSGQMTFDLSSLGGTILGLQFDLLANPFDASLSSTLLISNLQLTSVPEPPTLLLFSVAALSLCSRIFRSRPSGRTQT